MEKKIQFCDDCRFGALDPSTGDIHCRKKQRIYFQAPPNEIHLGIDHYKRRQVRWGWRPVEYCKFYLQLVLKSDEQPPYQPATDYARNPGRKKKRRKFEPFELPVIPPATGPTTERLTVRDDLPGLDALTKKYASSIEAGRLTARRLEDK